MELLTSLQYKPLSNINRSEKWGKKIQTAGYNGARTVYNRMKLYKFKVFKIGQHVAPKWASDQPMMPNCYALWEYILIHIRTDL